MTRITDLLKDNYKFIAVLVVFSMVVTTLIVPRLPGGVDVSISLSVPVPERPRTQDYEFDGYYALQATDLFSETLAGWFRSPDFAAGVYEKAGIPAPENSLRTLSKIFSAKKISGQLINIEYHAQNANEGGKIAKAAANLLQERVDAFNEKGNSALSFSVVANEPLLIPVNRNVFTRALIVGVVVLVLAANFFVIKDSLT